MRGYCLARIGNGPLFFAPACRRWTACATFRAVSTLAEIEKAIETLPPEDWMKIRRWMDSRAPVPPRVEEMAGFDRWLTESTGIAKGRFTTDERMRETRGED